MKGDFSRIRFNAGKLYTAVLKQQGRVDLDSDANEQCAIDVTLRETTNADIIGQYGGPVDGAGFEISIDSGEILISAGRYYVEGILVEIADQVHYDNQPYLLDPTNNAQQLLDSLRQANDGSYLEFKLEVWQRMATALDDPCLLEPALNQADTTTRLQTIWRVVGTLKQSQAAASQPSTVDATQPSSAGTLALNNTDTLALNNTSTSEQSSTSTLELNNQSTLDQSDQRILKTNTLNASQLADEGVTKLGSGGTTAQSSASATASTTPSTVKVLELQGMMGASTSGDGSGCGCQPIPAAGYQGMENQLYRVEIHQSGDITSATFKWSRENGSVVVAVTDVNGKTVTVASLGPDANLGFQPGQWVELSDNIDQFGPTANKPGTLYQIHSINQAALQVTMTTPVTGLHKKRNARMRRWDQSGSSATASGIPVSSTPVPLENGIEVDFSKGQFQAGDYWTIPARTASGTIDWPPCGGNGKHFQAPSSIQIYKAPLACASWMSLPSGDPGPGLHNDLLELTFLVTDQRSFFPTLAANAMHIDWISWDNADLMTLDQFLYNGLYLALDAAPTSPLDAAVFRISLEIAGANYYRQADYNAVDEIATNQNTLNLNLNAAKADGSLTLNTAGSGASATATSTGTSASSSPQILIGPALRQEYVLDGVVTKLDRRYQVGWVVNWNLPVNADQGGLVSALNSLLVNAYQSTANANANTNLTAGNNNFQLNVVPAARVRVRLFGHMIYAEPSSTCGPARTVYLDGQCFGKTGTLSDGSKGIALKEPSGLSAVASDFESWFYLAPAPQVSYVNFDPSNLTFTLGAVGAATGGVTSGTSTGTVTLASPPSSDTTINLTPGTLPAGITLTAFSQSIVIAAGQTSNTFPVAVQVSPVASSGQFTMTVTATPQLETTDISNIFSAQGYLYLTVNNPVSITTTSLPAATVGRAYSTTLAAVGGVTPYTWSLTSGSLPAGTQLSSSGVISGTPTTATAAAPSTFTVQVADSSAPQATASKQFTIQVYPALEITTSQLPQGTNGTAYPSTTFAATGGEGSYTWKVTSGNLPAGMAFSTAGVLSGTPGNAITVNVTFEVTDSFSPTPNTASKTLSLVINIKME